MIEFPVTPLPRWTILPGDPAPLRRWLLAKQAAEQFSDPGTQADSSPRDSGKEEAA